MLDIASALNSGSFGIAMLIALVGGLLTNLTPCVFPMIPITLRLLSREGRSPTLNSLLYGAGIAITYTSLGLIAALGGAMFGSMLASHGFSYFLVGLMFILGLTMLGYGDLSKLQNAGLKLGNKGQGPWQTLMMGVGAGFVAAPCTDPILAALLTYTARAADVGVGAGLLFTYAVGFSLPYILLSRVATKVTKFKVPPQVLISVKLAFASVMFALTFYYAKTPLHEYYKLIDWNVVYPIAIIGGLYLVGTWIYNKGKRWQSIIATGVLGLGLFAWVYAGSSDNLPWYTKDVPELRHTGKPLLIDAWASWCEACKKMDSTTFSDSEVQEELTKHWTLLKLDITESNTENKALIKKYNLIALPTIIFIKNGRQQKIQGYQTKEEFLEQLKRFRGG